MKPRFLLLATCFLSYGAAKANTGGPGIGDKNELNGLVIHAESKKPLRDVSVTAILISKKEKVVKTDQSGNFAFDELKPGTYKFIFEKTGFKKITKEKVVIKTDEAFQLNIEMIETNDFEIIPSPFSISRI